MFEELDGRPAPAGFEHACRERLEHLLAEGGCVGWIAESPDVRTVGALVLLTYPRLPTPGNLRTVEGYVLNVYVVPGARHGGIALALTRAAVEHARRERFARLRLHTSASGRRVYERAGFRGRDNEMELDLAP